MEEDHSTQAAGVESLEKLPHSRPALNTSVTLQQDITSPTEKVPSADATTPDALSYYRQHVYQRPKPPPLPSSSTPSHSFERPALRSVSNPLLAPSKPISTTSKAPSHKTSAKDLIAKYNQNGTPKEGPASRKSNASPVPAGRSSNMDSSHPALMGETPKTPAPMQSSTTVPDSPISPEVLDQARSSDLSLKLTSRFSMRGATYGSFGNPTSQPLFGEVNTSKDSDLAAPGYGIPRRRNGKRESGGLMSFAGQLPYHARSRSDLSGANDGATQWWENENYKAGVQASSSHQRTSSEAEGFQEGNDEPQEPVTPKSSGKAPLSIPRSRIPITIPPRAGSQSATDLSQQPNVPETPPLLLSPQRYDPSGMKSLNGGQRVKAIVTPSSVPKVSPPLRSSRPRQSIGDHSSSSYPTQLHSFYSRGSPERNTPSPRRRKATPDMSHMDVAMRRESIRRAIKRSGSQHMSLEQIAQAGEPPATLAPSVYIDESRGATGGSKMGDVQESTEQNSKTPEPEAERAPSSDARRSGRHEDEYMVSEPADTPVERKLSNTMPGSYPDTSGPEDSASIDTPVVSAPRKEDDEQQKQQLDRPSRTVLSQIMEMRNRSTRSVSQFGMSEGMSPDGDDAGTIQIMLGDTLMLEKGVNGEQGFFGAGARSVEPASPENKENKGNQDDGQGANVHTGQPVEHTTSTNSLNSSSLSIKGHRGSYSLQSDAYSIIHKIVDEYRIQHVITDEMVAEFQHHIIDNDPLLSKDDPPGSKELVARLALKELVQEESNGLGTPASENRDSYVSDDTGHQPTPQNRVDGTRNGHSRSSVHYLQPEVSITEPHPVDRDQDTQQSDVTRTPSPKPKGDTLTPNNAISDLSRVTTGTSVLSDTSGLGLGSTTLAELELAYGGIEAKRGSAGKPSNAKLAHFFGIDQSRLPPGGVDTFMDPPADDKSTTPKTIGGKAISGPYFIPPVATDPSSPISNSVIPRIMSVGADDNRPTSYTSDGRTESFDHGSQRQSQSFNADDPAAEERRLTKRKNLIKELVDTEYSYNQDMKVVEDIYMGTVNAVEQMSADDRRILFGNTAEIVKFSETFLDALKQAGQSVYVMPRSNRWQKIKRASFSTSNSTQTEQSTNEQVSDETDRKSTIGQAFCSIIPQMEKVYGDYLKNHDSANQRLVKLQGIHQVSLWLNECHTYASDITSAWDLDSLLVKPVQRILKYPLLLKSLLEVTPTDHPDFYDIELAAREMMNVSARINESKKRAEILEQVVNRKPKDIDLTWGLSKAFGRRTEKLRQQVGLADAVDDPEYKTISAKYGGTFFQLQVVMRDFQNYKRNVESFMNQYNALVDSFEGFIDVGMSTSPELESKWRKFANTIREIIAIAYVDHEAAVRKSCIDPLITLIKMNEGPQKLIQKRKKRLIDYAKYKSMKDKGDKPDKKTTEQGEQFIALNDTLKDELPKLFGLTKKLVNATLRNFVDLQAHWNLTWQRKIQTCLEEAQFPKLFPEIAEAFKIDFAYPEASVLALGICNGSVLAETANFLSSSVSVNSGEKTPVLTSGPRRGTGYSQNGGQESPIYIPYAERLSADVPHSQRFRSNSSNSIHPPRPGPYPVNAPTSNSFYNRQFNQHLNQQGMQPQRKSTDAITRPVSGSTAYYSTTGNSLVSNGSPYGSTQGLLQGSSSASGTPPTQSSSIFSSAMPLDHSRSNSNNGVEDPRSSIDSPRYRVLFLAASLFEFNIDRARKEAGYPYLTYVPGEVFDVIGEKGELWLAKNQDDPSNTLGWIWEKHFAKLMQDDL